MSNAYLENSTIVRSLAFQIIVLEMLKQVNFSKNHRSGPIFKIRHPVKYIYFLKAMNGENQASL